MMKKKTSHIEGLITIGKQAIDIIYLDRPPERRQHLKIIPHIEQFKIIYINISQKSTSQKKKFSKNMRKVFKKL